MTQEVWNKIINSEMLLIGIGTQLSVKEDNEKQIDEVYDTLAKLAKGRNCFVITSNTDQKLLDGRISKFLTAAPKVEGQEKQWEAYMNWLSCSLTHELTILELGEGFADPMPISTTIGRFASPKLSAGTTVNHMYRTIRPSISNQDITITRQSRRNIGNISTNT